uniref:Uncharacterized protein n=1 Tax=Romanomermis culicivorax TaxID=13658 RepID=A0A915HI87_ROMCU
ESITSHENRKKYSLDFKVKTIAAVNKEGNRPVASRLKISESICFDVELMCHPSPLYLFCIGVILLSPNERAGDYGARRSREFYQDFLFTSLYGAKTNEKMTNRPIKIGCDSVKPKASYKTGFSQSPFEDSLSSDDDSLEAEDSRF